MVAMSVSTRRRRRRPALSCLPAAILLAGCCLVSPTAAADGPYRALGVAAGIPQIAALVYEHGLAPNVSLGFNAGGLIIANALGVRLLYGSHETGLHPYLFTGGVVVYMYALDGVADGSQGYFWSGAGLNMWYRRAGLFAEGGLLLAGREDRGFDKDSLVFPIDPVVSAGLKFRLGS
jgi:hypothetical protein